MNLFLKSPNSDKASPIILIYYVKTETSKNKYFKYSTGKSIHPDDWSSETYSPKPKRGGAGKELKQLTLHLNKYTKLLEDTIRKAEDDNISLTKEYLKNVFDLEFKNKPIAVSSKALSLPDVIQEFIDAKNKSRGMSQTWNDKYVNLKNKISFYDIYKQSQTRFEEINDDWIQAYCGFLRELYLFLNDKSYLKKCNDYIAQQEKAVKLPKQPYNDNTLNRHINYLFTFLKWSQGKHHNLDLDKIKNPIDDFQPEDVHLTLEEIKRLEEIELDNPAQERVRDVFLIGIYSGQRYSDYSIFEKEDVVETPDGDMIIKKSEKMEDFSFIPIHPKLRKLLVKYNWNLPSISSQKFNPHIQAVCRKIKMVDNIKTINYIGDKKIIDYKQKCDMVTSHTARRTFITISAEQGMPDHVIMKITGIKDVDTLKKYKKTSQNTVFFFANKVWG